jgi:hypothetical protein
VCGFFVGLTQTKEYTMYTNSSILLCRLAVVSQIVTFALAIHSPVAAIAAPIPVPAGLNPGDEYHLVFVSIDTRRNATPSDIDVYNAFVQGVADAAGIGNSQGINWRAIGSTALVDARDNALVTEPVYNMAGELVADGFNDIWDGTLLASTKVVESQRSAELIEALIRRGDRAESPIAVLTV